MKSKRARKGTKAWKKAGHKPLSWYIKEYGTSGKAKYNRGR